MGRDATLRAWDEDVRMGWHVKCLDKLAPAVCLHNMFSQKWTNDVEPNLERN